MLESQQRNPGQTLEDSLEGEALQSYLSSVPQTNQNSGEISGIKPEEQLTERTDPRKEPIPELIAIRMFREQERLAKKAEESGGSYKMLTPEEIADSLATRTNQTAVIVAVFDEAEYMAATGKMDPALRVSHQTKREIIYKSALTTDTTSPSHRSFSSADLMCAATPGNIQLRPVNSEYYIAKLWTPPTRKEAPRVTPTPQAEFPAAPSYLNVTHSYMESFQKSLQLTAPKKGRMI